MDRKRAQLIDPIEIDVYTSRDRLGLKKSKGARVLQTAFVILVLYGVYRLASTLIEAHAFIEANTL